MCGEGDDLTGAIPSALPATGTIDLRTVGRRSGVDRWVEIWFVTVDGELIIAGTPGPRSWLANVAADRRAVVRFRDPVREVPVTAHVVTDPAERRRLVPLIWAAQPWYAEQGYSVGDWVARSPIVRVADHR